MNKNHSTAIRILAIDPSVSGFGYAVLEGPELLVDWGVKSVAGDDKNARCLKWITHFIDLYRPDLVVLEDYKGKGSRRCRRVQELIEDVRKLAARHGIETRSFSRGDVRAAFAPLDARTKHEIAAKIGERLPELAPHVPPYRKCWMKEDERMNIFDATGLAFTFFHLSEDIGLAVADDRPRVPVLTASGSKSGSFDAALVPGLSLHSRKGRGYNQRT